MSKLRTVKNRDRASAWGRLWESFTGSQPRLPRSRKPRRLMIDHLEERQLLSVSPANFSDVLINQLGPDYSQYLGSQLQIDNQMAPGDPTWFMNGQAVAVDNNGDFVVAWTRGDSRMDSNGYMVSDANVYARYYTDAVQRITLPAGTTNFKLQYNGNEVQKLSISAGTTPFGGRDSITGSFDLTFGGYSATVDFCECAGFSANATAIQLAIDSLAAQGATALTGATVQAIDADNFLINFGDASSGTPLSTPLTGASTYYESNFTVSNTNFTSGFLASADMSVVRRPGQTVAIPLSSNSALTAQNIQYAFGYTTSDVLIGPVMFPQDEDITPDDDPYWAFNEPVTLPHGQPTITVTARGVREFDITFTGDSGKTQQPLLKVLTAASTPTNPILMDNATSTNIKQSSDEFRVNAPEIDDPETIHPDVYDQTNARVAMDADGDFVITWESTVPDSTSFGSVTDIFARRFSAAGFVQSNVSFMADMNNDGVADTYIQGVRPLGSEFRVNTAMTNPQVMPSIGMDDDGNFAIVWTTQGQYTSFFNSIQAQRFDRDGNRVGNEFTVNTVDDTSVNFNPIVALSHDGVMGVTWSITNDPAFYTGTSLLASVVAKVYDAQGAVLLDQFGVGGGSAQSITFDSGDNFVIGYDHLGGLENNGANDSADAYAHSYQLYDSTGAVSGEELLSEFRVNSADFDPTTVTFWPHFQQGSQVALDSDGDLTVAYYGFGPDVSENAATNTGAAATYLNRMINLTASNADLMPFYNDVCLSVTGPYCVSDPDATLMKALVAATNHRDPVTMQPAPATDAQLARLRSILENYLTLLRGDAYGVMFSQFDADPHTGMAESTILSSDDVANNNRDGQNMRWLLTLDPATESGGLSIRVGGPWTGYEDVDIAPVYYENDGPLNPYDTLEEIHDKIQSAVSQLGLNWPQPLPTAENPSQYEGPVSVRLVSVPVPNPMDPTVFIPGQEILDRQGTPWDPTDPNVNPMTLDGTMVFYEIDFLGEVHDSSVYLSVTAGSFDMKKTVLVLDPDTGEEVEEEEDTEYPGFAIETYANAGTTQRNPSIAMTSGGDFVMAWDEYSNGGTNMYFRAFQESTDTAGPLATDFLLPNTSTSDGGADLRVDDNDTVRQEMSYIVVTFDEAMMTTGGATGANSVLNPNNWALMRDGTLVVGGIDHIVYGMNEAATQLGMPSHNKWEAIVYLNGNGNSQTPTPYLLDGHYQIVATTALRDAASNALGRTGYQPNGVAFTRDFDVSLPTTTSETLVNHADSQTDQYTSPANEIQQITFTPTGALPLQGTFDLTIGSYTTVVPGAIDGSITFDGTDGNTLNQVAADIQMHLGLAGYHGAVVTVVSGAATPYVFSVRFGGVDTGIDQPPISITATNLEATPLVEELQTGDEAPPPQATASDASGNTVVVWTSNTPGAEGVYAKLYQPNWDVNTVGTRYSTPTVRTVTNPATNQPWANNEILVVGQNANHARVNSASVAMDASGNFIVTWSELNDNGTDWNVWFRRYDANGNALDAAQQANSITEDVQRHSVVAMDADGDFVIAWQSLNQDGDGYGIYAQRFDSAGNMLGGQNNSQTLSFVGQPTGTFVLNTPNGNTAAISYQGNAAATANLIESELAEQGQSVRATAVSTSKILIEYIGAQANQIRPQLSVILADLVGDPGATASIQTTAAGSAGEILVNDTTFNNQMYPSIAMDAEGEFVISWTGYGQDGDAAYQSNVYAKHFASSESLISNTSSTSQMQNVVAPAPAGITYQSLVVTTDEPDNHVVAPGSGMDGVVQLVVYRTDLPTGYVGLGSGTLLADGRHILTAAHMVDDDFGNMVATQIDVIFALTSGYVTITVSSAGILDHPQYNGSPWEGGADLAVLALPTMAPAGVMGHDINRDTSDSLGQIFTMVGYGNSGTGDTGETINTDIYAPKHSGQNEWEGYASLWGDYPDALAYDFDSGQAANDAFGHLFNIHDLGVGMNEASAAQGDSGGPNFLGNGLIAGVTSYGISIPGSWDAVAGLNSSFGDMGASIDVARYAAWIDAATQGTPEFRVNATSEADQKWSAVAMDATGDFVITWTSYGQDGSGNGPGAGVNGENGVYAQRYDSDGVTVGGEFLANTFTNNDQQYSNVAMNATGDFTIVWESYQDRTAFNGAGNNPADVADSYGIYGQRYVRNSMIGQPIFTGGPVITGPNGESLTEFQVNTTQDGDQRYPSISMDDNGDAVIVWSGIGTQTGQADTQGVFLQRFDLPSDSVAPRVLGTYNLKPLGNVLQSVRNGDTLTTANDDGTTYVKHFVVTFGKDMMTTGANSVLNLANWSLSLNGAVATGRIASVEVYTTNSYKITFDGNLSANGNQRLGNGTFVLTASDNIHDVFGNALDGDGDGLSGGSFTRSFSVQIGGSPVITDVPGPGTPPDGSSDTPVNTQAGNQYSPVVASDAAGNYVIVWADYSGNVLAQRYDNSGETVGSAITVNSLTYASDFSNTAVYDIPPRSCDVAMDYAGNFVVVWSAIGSADQMGVYARVFNAGGSAKGAEFLVNQHLPDLQYQPSVTMDSDGDFAVTWTSYGQDGNREDIHGRRFNSAGAATSNEFQVNTTGADKQVKSDVAMDSNGDFAVVWESYGQDGNMWGVFGQRFTAAGAKAGGEFRVNQYTLDKQMDPQVAIDSDGDFVVTWTSFAQDGIGYGIYARRYNAAGAAVGGEFRVSSVNENWQGQITPTIGMDSNGNYIVAWSSYGQESLDTGDLYPIKDYEIFARMFNANGTDYADPATDTVLGEFRINATTYGNQTNPAIGMSQNGECATAWIGSDTKIYSRLIGWGGTILGTTNTVAGLSTVGLYNPAASVYYLRNTNTSGTANSTFIFGPGSAGWITLSGDWDADGTDTIGLYDPATSRFYLRDSNSNGYATTTFAYGPGGAGWTPIVGDWNGNGRDTVGVYDPVKSRFHLRNSNSTGFADVTFAYGPGGAGWTPIVGDWNSDAIETVGLYNPALSRFYLRNSNSSGTANVTFAFGPGGAGWTPLVGDWNQDGLDTVGLYNPARAVFYQRDTNTSGVADATFSYGPASIGWVPLVGNWTGIHALTADDTGYVPLASPVPATLTQYDLQPILHEAIARWADAGLDAAILTKFSQVEFVVTDLSGSLLGTATGNRVYLDTNAAGRGWYVDSTPAADEEYAPADSNGQLQAVDARAVDRIDLLTVVEHELGHIAGLDDLDASVDDLMSGILGVGARRNASHENALDAVFSP